MLDSENEIIETMNFKTNYSLLKNIVQTQNSFNNNPPGFISPVKKPTIKLNYLLLNFLIINLPLFKNTDLNSSFMNQILMRGNYFKKII